MTKMKPYGRRHRDMAHTPTKNMHKHARSNEKRSQIEDSLLEMEETEHAEPYIPRGPYFVVYMPSIEGSTSFQDHVCKDELKTKDEASDWIMEHCLCKECKEAYQRLLTNELDENGEPPIINCDAKYDVWSLEDLIKK